MSNQIIWDAYKTMLIHKNIKKKFYSYDDCNFKDLPFFCSQHYLTADSIYAKLSIPMVSARERRWNCCSRVTSWENPTFRVVKTQLFRVTLQLLHIVESVHRDLGFELRTEVLTWVQQSLDVGWTEISKTGFWAHWTTVQRSFNQR